MSDRADAGLDARAKAWFEAQPHRHPGGRTPEWGMQPAGVRRIAALHAARLPWSGRLTLSEEQRAAVPQTALRDVADRAWRGVRPRGAAAACARLWAAAAVLDLDFEGFTALKAEFGPDHADVAPDGPIQAADVRRLRETLASIEDIILLAGDEGPSAPFRVAADLVRSVLPTERSR